MHVDGAFLHVHAAAPHVVEQLGAGVDPLRMGHEEVQQAVLGGADRHRRVVDEHAVGGAVDAHRADHDAAVLVVLAGAAHHRADPGQQLARRERLDHVVVHAGLQAADAVVLLAARGQHDDRHLAGEGVLAPAPGQLQPAGAGQHPVEQDQVGHAVGDGGLGLARIPGMDRLEIALAQGEGDHVADGGFVVDDQDLLLHAVVRTMETASLDYRFVTLG